MFICCTHKRTNNNLDCGIHYIRTLLHQPLDTQHNCLSDKNHKYITRTIGNLKND